VKFAFKFVNSAVQALSYQSFSQATNSSFAYNCKIFDIRNTLSQAILYVSFSHLQYGTVSLPFALQFICVCHPLHHE